MKVRLDVGTSKVGSFVSKIVDVGNINFCDIDDALVDVILEMIEYEWEIVE